MYLIFSFSAPTPIIIVLRYRLELPQSILVPKHRKTDTLILFSRHKSYYDTEVIHAYFLRVINSRKTPEKFKGFAEVC